MGLLSAGKASAQNVFSEFRTFIQRGNVLDLAVGVIIGTAFGKIVASLVENVLMPPIAFLTSGYSVSELTFEMSLGARKPVDLRYGVFLQSVIDFLIISLCVFFLVKGVNALNRFRDGEAPKAKLPSPEERLLTEIRDILKAKS